MNRGIRILPPIIILTLVIIFQNDLTTMMTSGQISSYTPTLSINWVIRGSPSSGSDRAYGVCQDQDYVYVVGYDSSPGNPQFRVEKRMKINGQLVAVWVYNPSPSGDSVNALFDCIVIGSMIYLIGGQFMGRDDDLWAILA